MSSTEEIQQQQQQQQPPTTDPSIFSHFPVEVVRLIFEFSAMQSDRTAASLVRVSKQVHRWILPILYETIVIERPRGFLKIVSTVSSASASQHLVPLIHNVCINLPGRFDAYVYQTMPFPREVDSLLRACTNIHNIYINDTHTPFRYPVGVHPRLTHLHCGSWDSWLNHDFLAIDSLTHLRVDLAYNSGLGPSWVPLLPPSTRLPNLTHLALGTDKRSPPSELRLTATFLRRILARPAISMLVLTVWYCPSMSNSLYKIFAEASDPRFCILMMLDCPRDRSSVREWQDEVRGGQSIWDKAATLMKRHREAGGQGIAMGMLQPGSLDYR